MTACARTFDSAVGRRLRVLCPGLAVALLCAGCVSSGVRFVQAPVPPLPNVLAGSDGKFRTSTVVLNSTDSAVPAGKNEIRIRAMYNTDAAAQQCVKEFVRPSIHLLPDARWVLEDFEFDAGGYVPGDPCSCTNANNCRGVVFLLLRNAGTNVRLPGPRTEYSIQFKKPGGLTDMTVNDLSD